MEILCYLDIPVQIGQLKQKSRGCFSFQRDTACILLALQETEGLKNKASVTVLGYLPNQ